MSVYAYTHSKIIDEVAFKRTSNGAARAYIHACPQVAPEKLEEVLEALKDAGMECIPFTQLGKPVLEVRGFRRDSQLVTLLLDKGFTSGEAHIIKEKSDVSSWGEIFQKRSLQLSGAAFMLADIGFMMYGHKKKVWQDTAAGGAYLFGSATLAAYGRNDQSSIQIREGAELILDYARQSGYAIPEDTAIASVGVPKKQSLLRKVDDLFKAHPSEIGNMAYVVAGGLIASSAMQHKLFAKHEGKSPKYVSDQRWSGLGDTALGMTTVTSGLIGTLVKEKAKDPDAAKPSGIFSSISEWVQHSPLRAASYGYMGSTLCHAFTTWKDRSASNRVLKNPGAFTPGDVMLAKEDKKAIPWRMLFVSATLVGELLMSISSKGHGEGVVSDNTVDDSIVAVAAELIIKQPQHMQEGLIGEMGRFLGRPEVLALKDQDAIDRLRKQVEEMRKNPWASKMSEMQAAMAQKTAAPETAAEGEKAKPASITVPKDVVPAWQTKLSKAEAQTPTNNLAV